MKLGTTITFNQIVELVAARSTGAVGEVSRL